MRTGWRGGAWIAVVAAGLTAGAAAAQELADYDYENLRFRGIMLEGGFMWADNVEDTEVFAMKFDLGFLGPGFRLVPGVSFWSSEMDSGELERFRERLTSLISAQGGTPPADGFDLGRVERDDVAISLDGHYLWSLPSDLFFYTGLGVSGHFLNGSGPAIDGTFVEDLLDSVSAGVNLHAGLEYAIADRIRLYGASKVEVLGDLRYLDLRFGGSIIWGGLVSGEARQP